jgi:hypothetical protein
MKCQSCGCDTSHLELDKRSMKLNCEQCLHQKKQPLEASKIIMFLGLLQKWIKDNRHNQFCI